MNICKVVSATLCDQLLNILASLQMSDPVHINLVPKLPKKKTLHLCYMDWVVLGELIAIYYEKYINLLKTKRRPLYLKTQSVPRCKHFSSWL